MSIFKTLDQPFPLILEVWTLIKRSLIAGCIVVLFLFYFRPFYANTIEISNTKLLIEIIPFGILTFLLALVFIGLHRSFPLWYNEASWTVGRELMDTLLFVFLLGLINACYGMWRYDHDFSFWLLGQWQLITISVGILPATIVTVMNQRVWLKKYQASSTEINENFVSPTHDQPSKTTNLEIASDNSTEHSFVRDVHDVQCILSADNYVRIYFIEGDVLKSTIIRTTLKKVEDVTIHHSSFYRCHRTAIVNLDNVGTTTGNAQGLKLVFRHSETPKVPVSRSLSQEIKQKLTTIRP